MDNEGEFQFDFNRVYDKEYIFNEQVLRFLFEKRYIKACYMYSFDGNDPEHFLYDKAACYESFKYYMERNYESDLDKINIDDVVLNSFKENSYLKKYYYYKTCVVCMQKRSHIIFDECKHFCLCKNCFDQILESTKECPLCRSQITYYRIGVIEEDQ